MRLGILADFHEMLAVLHKFSADERINEDDVAVGIVAADLAFALAQDRHRRRRPSGWHPDR